MLLGCPWPGHTETVNDADGLLANFWRALQLDPDAVAFYADWPVSECDLHARHRWLVDHRSMVEELLADPDWCDAKAAGWWVWGISQWIGTGWCPQIGAAHLGDAGQGVNRQLPALSGDSGASGNGVHAKKLARGITRDGGLWQQRPHLGGGDHDGMGVHRGALALARKRPAIGGRGHKGSVGGVHGQRLDRKMPHAGDAGCGGYRAQHLSQQSPELGCNRGDSAITAQELGHKMPFIASPSPDRKQHGLGIHGITHAAEGALYDYFRALAARLRRVRVVCGDFERILGPSVTWRHGTTAVFLDPPYADAEHAVSYSGGGNVWERVTAWCAANGDNTLLRIALCGYADTWDAPAGWGAIKWRTPGGYGSQGNGRGRENATREVVWFSPHCLMRIEDLPLFRGAQ